MKDTDNVTFTEREKISVLGNELSLSDNDNLYFIAEEFSKSGFKTKRDAYIAGQRAYEEFISGESKKECNMLYSEYLDYWMREYFEINYKYSTAKRYKESFGNIKRELGNYKLSAITSFSLNQALLRLYQTSTTKEALRNYQKVL